MILTQNHVVQFFNTRKSETFCGIYHCIFLSASLLSSMLINLPIKQSVWNIIKLLNVWKITNCWGKQVYDMSNVSFYYVVIKTVYNHGF